MTKSGGCSTRRLLVAGLIATLALVLVMTATAAILLTGSGRAGSGDDPAATGISLEEWLGGSLSTKSFNGTWLSGKSYLRAL